jgi:hypothetical protein
VASIRQFLAVHPRLPAVDPDVLDPDARRNQPVGSAGKVEDPLERTAADRRRIESDQVGHRAGSDDAASGESIDLSGLAGEPPDGFLQREDAGLAYPPLEEIGGEVGVAQLTGVRPRVLQAQQQRVILQ